MKDRVSLIAVWRWTSRWLNPRLRLLDPDKQAQGKLYFYRPATASEVQAWRGMGH